MRNLVAVEMQNKFKAKSFSGRGKRRAGSNRNKFDWRSDAEELDFSEENNSVIEEVFSGF